MGWRGLSGLVLGVVAALSGQMDGVALLIVILGTALAVFLLIRGPQLDKGRARQTGGDPTRFEIPAKSSTRRYGFALLCFMFVILLTDLLASRN